MYPYTAEYGKPTKQAHKSSEDTQAAGYASAWKSLGLQKLRLEKTLVKKSLVMVATSLVIVASSLVMTKNKNNRGRELRLTYIETWEEDDNYKQKQ